MKVKLNFPVNNLQVLLHYLKMWHFVVASTGLRHYDDELMFVDVQIGAMPSAPAALTLFWQQNIIMHGDVKVWRRFPDYWLFVRESTGHRWIPFTKGQ